MAQRVVSLCIKATASLRLGAHISDFKINMFTRQLRSQTKDSKTGAKRKLDYDELDESSHPRQRSRVLYHCRSCLSDLPSRNFPNYNPSPDCKYLINTCEECLQGWVDAQIKQNLAVTDEKDNTVFGLKCPECPASMQTRNLRAATSSEIYQIFDKQKRNHIAETTSGWFWCQNPRCNDGAVLKDETAKVATCAKCGSDSCVPCHRLAYPRETCAKYQVRIKDRVDEEDKSLETIRKVTKPCPKCGVRV